MGLVCFDTQVIVWGVKKQASPGQEDMIPKAENLILKCEEERIDIIVPSLVLAEILSGTNFDQHQKLMSLMHKRFMVVPFDAQSALLFARMWKDRDKDLAESEGIKREHLKVDYMIASVAKARGASCLYSEDPHMASFAGKYIKVSDIPSVTTQGKLAFDC